MQTDDADDLVICSCYAVAVELISILIACPMQCIALEMI